MVGAFLAQCPLISFELVCLAPVANFCFPPPGSRSMADLRPDSPRAALNDWDKQRDYCQKRDY